MNELKEKINNSNGNELGNVIKNTSEEDLIMLVTDSPEFILMQDILKMQYIMCLMPEDITNIFVQNNEDKILNKVKNDKKTNDIIKAKFFTFQDFNIFNNMIENNKLKEYLLSLQTTTNIKGEIAPFTSIFSLTTREEKISNTEANIVRLIDDDKFKEKIVKINVEKEYDIIINGINMIMNKLKKLKENNSSYDSVFTNVYKNLSEIRCAREKYMKGSSAYEMSSMNSELYSEDKTQIYLIEQLDNKQIEEIDKKIKEIDDGTLYYETDPSHSFGQFRDNKVSCKSFTTVYMENGWFIGVNIMGEVCCRALGEKFSKSQNKCEYILNTIARQRGLEDYREIPHIIDNNSLKL